LSFKQSRITQVIDFQMQTLDFLGRRKQAVMAANQTKPSAPLARLTTTEARLKKLSRKSLVLRRTSPAARRAGRRLQAGEMWHFVVGAKANGFSHAAPRILPVTHAT
jgi:hypothetical protein